MRTRLLSLMWIALLAMTGCGDLDPETEVKDLRLLALRSEPPEQVFAVPFDLSQLANLLDGGLRNLGGGDGGIPNLDGGLPNLDGGLPSIPGFDLSSLVKPVTVTALVADPAGAGRPIQYEITTCSALDSSTSRCLPGSPKYAVLKAGEAFPRAKWVELAVTFTPSLELLLDAQQKDPYRGFGGIWLPVQVSIQAGDEKVVGFKRVVFTPYFSTNPLTLPPANTNPFIPTMRVQGQLWARDETFSFTSESRWEIAPEPVAALEEDYVRQTFTGELLPFKESWRYDFFATRGTFPVDQSGGSNAVLGIKNKVAVGWEPREGESSGEFDVLVVVRDGRGGENWTVRKGLYAPK